MLWIQDHVSALPENVIIFWHPYFSTFHPEFVLFDVGDAVKFGFHSETVHIWVVYLHVIHDDSICEILYRHCEELVLTRSDEQLFRPFFIHFQIHFLQHDALLSVSDKLYLAQRFLFFPVWSRHVVLSVITAVLEFSGAVDPQLFSELFVMGRVLGFLVGEGLQNVDVLEGFFDDFAAFDHGHFFLLSSVKHGLSDLLIIIFVLHITRVHLRWVHWGRVINL